MKKNITSLRGGVADEAIPARRLPRLLMDNCRLAMTMGCFCALSGCAVVEPFVQDFNIISVPQEAQIGQQLESEIATQMPVLQDSTQTQRVKNIGQKLVNGLPRKDFNYRFHVVQDKTPNAFTIPGGIIYIHTGLLNFVGSDDELAGVMAHEIGHAYARHPAKGLSRSMGLEYLSSLIFKQNQKQLRTIALQLAKGGLLRYSRQDEFQADELGYYIMRPSGYRTDGLLRFLSKLQSLQSGSSGPSFLSTHPPTPERITRLQQLEQGAPVQLPLVQQNFQPGANVAPQSAAYYPRRMAYNRSR